MLVGVYVLVGVLVFNRVRGNGHHQTPVLHALQADELIGKMGHLGRLAMYDQHLEAGVVVQVRVASRDHQFVVLVLRLGQFFRNAAGVVVVDEGYRAHHGRLRGGGLLGYQPVANQIAKGFRPVGVAAPSEGAVKPLEKIRIERDADPAECPYSLLYKNRLSTREDLG